MRDYCSKYNWSLLYTKDDKLSLAQNIAIKIHANAEYIYKIDEDIFIGLGYFDGLLDTYNSALSTSIMKIGFVAPLLNVNGFSYLEFLKEYGLVEEYTELFGKPLSACIGEPIHLNGDSAKYIWEHCKDFDLVVEHFSNKESGYLICPHRFSIGAILFTRKFWEDIGYFDVGMVGVMGLEEKQVCDYCMDNSCAIVVSQNVFAGHFGFYTQKETMKEYFYSNGGRLTR